MKKCALKKAVCLLCCLGLIMTGCTKDRLLNPKKPVALEIWHYYNGPQKIAFDELLKEFNETVGQEKGITVEGFNQGSVEELVDKVIEAAEKKVGAAEVPNMFAAYADTAVKIDEMGLVASLDPYLTKEMLDEYIPEYIEEGRIDAEGNLKIFPIAKSTEVLILNKTDWLPFSKETGADLTELSTIEGVTKAAENYYNWTASKSPDGKTGKALFGRDAMANYFILGSMQLGVEIFEVKDGKTAINLDEEVFRKLWDNYYIPFVKGHFDAQGRFRSDDVKMGVLTALVGSTTGSVYFPDKVSVSDTENYPIEVTVMPSPCFEGAEKYAVQQGAGMVVTKSTEAKEYAATVFLRWFTDTERNVAFSAASGYLPVKKEANNTELLTNEMDQKGTQWISKTLHDTLIQAMNITNTHTFYANKAVSVGNEVRRILENSMADRAVEDRKWMEKEIQDGKTREECLAKLTDEKTFKSWFTDLRADVEKVTR